MDTLSTINMESKYSDSIKFSGPAFYQITVQGKIPPRFFNQFTDFRFVKNQPMYPGENSTVVGRISDQSQLKGVLNSLYTMHFVVLEVSAIKELEDF